MNGEYETLLSGKNVTFTIAKRDPDTPEWTRALLDGSVRLIGMKEVSPDVKNVARCPRRGLGHCV